MTGPQKHEVVTNCYVVNGVRWIRLPDDLDKWVAVRLKELPPSWKKKA